MLLAIFRDVVSKNRILFSNFLSLCSLLPSCCKIFYKLSSLADQYGYCYCSQHQLLYSYFSLERSRPQLRCLSIVYEGSFLTVTFFSVTRARAVIDPSFRSQVRPATILASSHPLSLLPVVLECVLYLYPSSIPA